MSLTANFSLTIGALEIDVDLDVDDGQVLALLGPNGAGKSTVLRTLAGLQAIEHGRISVDEVVLEDATEGRFVPAEGRPIGMVFQEYLLFPHMNVLDNVAFGQRSRGVAKKDANAAALSWIETVGLAGFERSRPGEISGGQAQRVALARALATNPRLLLLDEPLAALDVATRSLVRRDLRHHLAEFGGATVLVTHDPLDALALADQVAVLENGTITQSGPIAEVTARPRTPYVAELLGVNLLRGDGHDHEVRISQHVSVTTGDAVHGEAFLLIRPSSIALHLHRPDTSARNQWQMTIVGFDLLGDRVRVRLAGDISLVADITPTALAELGLTEGTAVWASVKATDIGAYPA